MTRATRADAYEEGRLHRGPCGHFVPCGCQGVAGCCFSCTLPKCRFDAGGNLRIQLRRHRQDQARVMRSAGRTRQEIADFLGVTLSSVDKLLKRR